LATTRVINLRDSSFSGQHSLSLGGENYNEPSHSIQWARNPREWGGTCVFTDKHLREAHDYNGRAIALLVEPPSLHQNHYRTAFDMLDVFDAVLTHWATFAQRSPKIHYFPLGGSWIPVHKWGLLKWVKTSQFSLVTTQKQRAPGHKMRAQAADLSNYYDIDLWGRGSNPMTSKVHALAPYHYSIVIESMRCPGYFSEKLIDCISVGTVPLYWGDPLILDVFPGLPIWDNLTELETHLTNPPKPTIEQFDAWYNTAYEHRCAENHILKTGVFDD